MKKIWKGFMRDLWIVLLDILAVNAAYFVALLLRFYANNHMPSYAQESYLPAFLNFAPYYTALAIAVFAAFRLYGGMWQFAGINDMNRIVGANAVTTVIQILGTMLVFVPENHFRMPFTYYALGALMQFLFVSLIRFGYRLLLVEKKKMAGRKIPTVPAMVIGAGETARRAIAHMDETPFRAVVAVDEKSAGKTLNGIPVVADYTKSLSSVEVVFIADQKLEDEKRREILEKCEAANIEVQDYTGMLSNLGGRVPVSSLLGLIQGPVKICIEEKEMPFANGAEALKELKERYEVEAIEGATVKLKKPSSMVYEGYDAWARRHKEETGEDVSFF